MADYILEFAGLGPKPSYLCSMPHVFFKIKDDFEVIHKSNNQKLPDRRIQDDYHSIAA